MTSQTTVDKTTQNVIKAVKEWLSREGNKEMGLMDLAVLEELIAQALETGEDTPELESYKGILNNGKKNYE